VDVVDRHVLGMFFVGLPDKTVGLSDRSSATVTLWMDGGSGSPPERLPVNNPNYEKGRKELMKAMGLG